MDMAALDIVALNQKERPYAPPVANSWLCHCHKPTNEPSD